jgi:hypothetical protein
MVATRPALWPVVLMLQGGAKKQKFGAASQVSSQRLC